MTIEQMLSKIDELSQDTLIATNSGTFGASECCRAVGTGDTACGEWREYERLDGTRYTRGATVDCAPGYAREFFPLSASVRREKIAAIKEAMKFAKTGAQHAESRRADLARGWDGFRFIGIDEGQRILAAMDGR